MKDIRKKLIELFSTGYCTPQVARLAKVLKVPATTLHYNIKQLEKDKVLAYKAVFRSKAIEQGYVTYLLLRLNTENYGNAEDAARKISKSPNVESVDIITGAYELIIKLRFKDSEEYYNYVQNLIKKMGVAKAMSMTSLKQFKTEFVEL